MRHHWISVLTIVIVLTVGSGSALAPPQDALELTTENATASPGNNTTVTVTITNTGNETIGGNYSLIVNASTVPAGWHANVSNTTVVRGPLAPNESRTTNLTISIPENASTGDYELQIQLASGNRTWTTSTMTVHVPSTEESSNRGTDDGGSSTTEHTATTAENVSGGGVALAAGGDGPSKWNRLLAFLRSPKGIAVLASVMVALGFATLKSR